MRELYTECDATVAYQIHHSIFAGDTCTSRFHTNAHAHTPTLKSLVATLNIREVKGKTKTTATDDDDVEEEEEKELELCVYYFCYTYVGDDQNCRIKIGT